MEESHMKSLKSLLRDELLTKWETLRGTPDSLTHRELEFRLWNHLAKDNVNLELVDFHRIVDYYKKLARHMKWEMSQNKTLDICPEGHTTGRPGPRWRLTLTGSEDITRFCQTNSLDGLETVVIIKDKQPSISHPGWYYRYQLSTETNAPRGGEQHTLSRQASGDVERKRFCYKNRMSITDHEHHVRYDFTVVKGAVNQTFSDMLRRMSPSQETYQVEMEYLGDFPDDPTEHVNALVESLYQLVAVYRDTNLVLPQRSTENVVTGYVQRAFGKHALPDYQEHPQHAFIGMNVRGFEHYHLKKPSEVVPDGDSILIRKYDYLVTHKVDGLRRLLYVDHQGYLHLISDQMRVNHTGYQLTEPMTHSSILDGELVTDASGVAWFYPFDCFICGERELRTRLMETYQPDQPLGKEVSRLNALRNIIEQFSQASVRLSDTLQVFHIVGKPYYRLWSGDQPNLKINRNILESASQDCMKCEGLIFSPNYFFEQE